MRQYSVPAVEVHWTADEDATVADPYESAAHKIRQEGVADTYSPHLMTQVNRLRDQGIVGRGVKVAVIDTGVSHSLYMGSALRMTTVEREDEFLPVLASAPGLFLSVRLRLGVIFTVSASSIGFANTSLLTFLPAG